MHFPQAITAMLNALDATGRRMPATTLYNEGWMLRLILAAAEHHTIGPIAQITQPRQWFSECQLHTRFGRRCRPYSESNTRADGVVGDFRIDSSTRCGIQVCRNANRFQVFEAKLFAPLSAGTRNAPGYDQAARYVACMAFALQRADRPPADLASLGFYVVAPQCQINAGVFANELLVESIRRRVGERINKFQGQVRDELDSWRQIWFQPLLDRLELQALEWEELIDAIPDIGTRNELNAFYQQCLAHNRPLNPAEAVAGQPTRGSRHQLLKGRFRGRTVCICNPGRRGSGAYLVDHLDQRTLHVPNEDLGAPLGEPAELLQFITGHAYRWDRHDGQPPMVVTVEVPGPCQSRVSAAQVEGTFKVPNHQLSPN